MVGFAGFFVVVWLLDSGREHLCSCFAQIDEPSLLWPLCFGGCGGGGFGVCFCCVCVCGDKL